MENVLGDPVENGQGGVGAADEGDAIPRNAAKMTAATTTHTTNLRISGAMDRGSMGLA